MLLKFPKLRQKIAQEKTILKEIQQKLRQEKKRFPQKSQSRIHTAIRFIEGYEHNHQFKKAREILETEISLAQDLEEKGTGYYYLLRLLLHEHLVFENKEARELYQLMHKNFLAYENICKKEYHAAKTTKTQTKVKKNLKTFYQLVDSYFLILEEAYKKKGFREARDRTHEDKMHFRKRYHSVTGNHFKHIGHIFLDKTSRYGHSFGRWGITVLIFITIFAGSFAALDQLNNETMFLNYQTEPHPFDYFYFSIVTFTTLGYGDLVPVTPLEKLIVSIEVMLGFIMLGVFINLIQRRL